MPEQNRILCRELSLLAFNRRVLAQVQDTKVPLLERLRFFCIVSSNLDEFFGSAHGVVETRNKLRPHQPLDNGKTAAETIEAVARGTGLDSRAVRFVLKSIAACTQPRRYSFLSPPQMDGRAEKDRNYFDNGLLPILTPIGL